MYLSREVKRKREGAQGPLCMCVRYFKYMGMLVRWEIKTKREGAQNSHGDVCWEVLLESFSITLLMTIFSRKWKAYPRGEKVSVYVIKVIMRMNKLGVY